MLFIPGGRNNRAYKIHLDGKDYFLKHYNKNSDPTRSRLQAEYTFLSYAAECHSQHVTRPVSYDEEKAIGVYEFIDGSPYHKGEIGEHEVSEALSFIKTINQYRLTPAAQKLSPASEACFSIAEHIACVNFRVDRLQAIPVNDEIDQMALNFVEKELSPVFLTIKEVLLSQVKKHHLTLNDSLSFQNRIVSPSDFGFHNALKLSDGRIMFVDFEYSGWDDPAKLIADFFNQIEIPVTLDYFEKFAKEISTLVTNSEEMMKRAELLLPLYKLKWCCIILNYFLPLNKLQKDFVSVVKQKDRILQLNKAKILLGTLT